MKKVIVYFTTLLLSIPTLMFAQEPNSLHVQKVDGTVQSASLVSIQYITFEEDVLVLTTSEGEFRLPLNDVEKITFSENNTSAVENVNINSIQISKSGNILTIKSDAAIKHLYLVDMSGKVLVSERLASVDMTNLTLPNSGVFILFLETNQGYIARKVIHN
ncbi:MAG: hypothetical protein J6A35_07030 [Paludibacteraceae bacterium]|nr:hypothetical protein [Paludibacteraceae bacterium]